MQYHNKPLKRPCVIFVCVPGVGVGVAKWEFSNAVARIWIDGGTRQVRFFLPKWGGQPHICSKQIWWLIKDVRHNKRRTLCLGPQKWDFFFGSLWRIQWKCLSGYQWSLIWEREKNRAENELEYRSGTSLDQAWARLDPGNYQGSNLATVM